MTDEPLLVDSVEIHRAPGFESGGFQIEDLSAGLNIIHGPNASGKTTLSRSVRWLFWPDQAHQRASVVGHFTIDGTAWFVDLDRGQAAYQREGQDANRPSLPPSDQADRYALSLHQLLQHETTNESFARTITREAAGGFDLAAAASDLGFDDAPATRRKGEVKTAQEAVNALQEVQQEVEKLREDQRRLPSLEQELEEVQQARDRLQLLEQAISYADARDEMEEAQRRVSQFPDVLEDLDGDEAEEVAELDERIERLEREKADAIQARDEAQERLAETDLPEECLPGGLLEELKERNDTLADLERTLELKQDDLDEYETRRAEALEAIPLAVNQDTLENLEPRVWGDLNEFARTATRFHETTARKDAIEQWLRATDRPEVDQQTLQRGTQALESWLANPATTGSTGGATPALVTAVSGLLVGALGMALGMLVHPVGFVALLGTVALLAYAYQQYSGSSDGISGQRKSHQESFTQLHLEGPTSWTEDDVRERLLELYDELAVHELESERERRREALTWDTDDIETLEEEVEEQRSMLQESLGVAPDAEDFELVATADGIRRWQQAQAEVEGLEEAIERLENTITETREELTDSLSDYGYAEVEDAPSARGYIRDLETRETDHREAARDIAEANNTIESAEEDLEKCREQREKIFTRIGLDSDAEDELQDLCEQVEDYRTANGALRDARVIAEQEEAELEEHPGFTVEVTERSVAELKQERRNVAETAETYDDLRDEIRTIEMRVDDAKRENELEDALTGKDRALDGLADLLERDYDAMVGQTLVDHVRTEVGEASQPGVFEQAREILARITHGRYDLDLDVDEALFRAKDTVSGRGLALDELSSATRLQLLLAVRIAFVEEHEQGTAVPVFLDETLANTDDGKAEVIIESILELVREGRQVFYFTAQGDEVAKWRMAVEDRDDIEHSTIDLAKLRGLEGRIEVPDVPVMPTGEPSLPDPTEHDHASYGETLDIPPFDIQNDSDSAHLWYLIEDLELLHHLLELGIERWGQLRTLLDTGGWDVLTDNPDQLADIEYNGRAIEELVAAWNRGRGEPVTRDVLQASGAVSDTFIDEVTDLAETVDGDAERIIKGLREGRVNRFRSNKIDELETYFEEQGYIEPIDPLEPEHISVRVMEALVSEGLSREEAREQGQRLLARLRS